MPLRVKMVHSHSATIAKRHRTKIHTNATSEDLRKRIYEFLAELDVRSFLASFHLKMIDPVLTEGFLHN